MVTAMQGARIKAAAQLMIAREALLLTRSMDCFQSSYHGTRIISLISQIDIIIADVVPNSKIVPNKSEVERSEE